MKTFLGDGVGETVFTAFLFLESRTKLCILQTGEPYFLHS